MNLEYEFSKEELLKAKIENRLNSSKFIISEFIWLFWVNPFILLICFLMVIKSYSIKVYIEICIISFFLSLVIYFLFRKKLLKHAIKRNKGNLDINNKILITYEINSNEIHIKQGNYTIKFECPSILKVVISDDYIHIYLPIDEMVFIPKETFKDSEALNQFLSELRNKIANKTFADKENRKIKSTFKQIKNYFKDRA